MLSKTQKRVVLGAAALVVVVLFVVPAINVNRFRLSVARSLSEAVGREVTVQSISIQTFPQPGLLLHDVSVDDDPTISAEPMLHADEVLATLRISSLWRGRLEIASLKLSYPSLNLVRANDGRWNLEPLLERARETPAAPTAKTRPESRPRFPYIESDGGRINLKIGNEKKVFALTDADFAVWLASENEWRMRLEARPIRTDANLSDTGTLKIQGSWRRASELHETPLSMKFWWDYGQLGQITHLIYGRDRGWRGGVQVSGTITGKPEDLAIRLDTRIDDFRRYDILTGRSVSLEAHCNTNYNFTEKKIDDFACQMPAGGGVVLVNGNYAFLPKPRIDLSLTAENVPMQFLAVLARRAKRDLPNDMSVNGTLSAVLAVKGEYGHRLWAGNGEISDVQVRSHVLSSPMVLEASRWTLIGPGSEAPKPPKAQRSNGRHVAKRRMPLPNTLAWELHPAPLKLGDGPAPSLAAWFSHDGYYTELRGQASLNRISELATLLGLPAPASGVTGSADGSVQISGEWAGFVPPTITGEGELKNVTARLGGVASPLRISSAHFVATRDSFSLAKSAATIAGLHSRLEFSANWPQHCSVSEGGSDPSKCAMQFNVTADQLNTDEINALLNPKAQKHPWYAFLASALDRSKRSHFPEIYANGRISASKVIMKSLVATGLNSKLSLDPKSFALRNMEANVLGGKFSGELMADWSNGQPRYHAKGSFQRLSMPEVARLFNDQWATGIANFEVQGEATGWAAADLAASATGRGTFSWADGALRHILVNDRPLRFKTFHGKLSLSGQILTIADGALQQSSGIYVVSGTASLSRRLELTLARKGTPAYSITGTLERPTIALLRVSDPQTKVGPSNNR